MPLQTYGRLTFMSNLLIIFVCLCLGILFRKFHLLKEGSHFILNVIILHVPLPALILLNVPKIKWSPELFAITLTPWIFFFLAWLVFSQLGRISRWKKSLTGCLILTAGLGNTSFVGFPIIEALYGKESLKFAILYDQPGTFLIVSSLGILMAAFYSDQGLTPKEMGKKIITFPPFVAFTLALLLGLFQVEWGSELNYLLERLSLLLTPLALISVGLQLKLSDIKDELKPLAVGLSFKLILTPLLAFLLWEMMNVEAQMFNVIILESAMAPMITAAIVAQTYNLEPKLAGLMVGLFFSNIFS